MTVLPSDYIIPLRYFFASLVFIFLVLSLTSGSSGIALSISFFIYITIFFLPFFYYSRNVDLFNPLIFGILWSLVWSNISPFTLAFFGIDYHRTMPWASSAAYELAIIQHFLFGSLALVSSYFGFWLAPATKRISVRTHNLFAPKLVAIIWVALGITGLLAIAQHTASINEIFLQRTLTRSDRLSSEIGAHWQALIRVLLIGPLFWVIVQPKAFRSMLFWTLVVFSIGLGFLVSGSRSGLVSNVVVVLLVYIALTQKIPVSKIILAAIVAVMLAGLGTAYRYDANAWFDGGGGAAEALSNPFQNIMLTFEEQARRSGEGSGALAVYLHVPRYQDHLLGRTYASIPFIPIPSALLPFEKPAAAGRSAAIHFGNRYDTAWPTGAVAEAYWNFSVVGVVLIFIGFGYVLKVAYNTFRFNPRHPLVLLVFLGFLTFSPGSDGIYSLFRHVSAVFLVYYFSVGLGMVFRRRA